MAELLYHKTASPPEEGVWPRPDATLEEGRLVYISKEGYKCIADTDGHESFLTLYNPDNHYLLSIPCMSHISGRQIKDQADEMIRFLKNDHLCMLEVRDGIYRQRSGRYVSPIADLQHYQRIEYATIANFRGILYRDDAGNIHIEIDYPDGSSAFEDNNSQIENGAVLALMVQKLQKEEAEKYDDISLLTVMNS